MFGSKHKKSKSNMYNGNETDTGLTYGASANIDDINARLRELNPYQTGEAVHDDGDESDDDGVLYTNSYEPKLPPLTSAPWGAWTEVDTNGLVIRGKTFLSDKVKVPVGTPIYRLAWVDMFKNDGGDRCAHIATRPESYLQHYYQAKLAKKRERAATSQSSNQSTEPISEQPVDPNSNAFLSPMIIINFMFPGPEGDYNLVLYMVRRIRPADSIERKRERAAKKSNPLSPPMSPQIPPPSPSLRSLSGSVNTRTQGLSMSGYVSESDVNPSNDSDSIDVERVRAFDRCLRIFLNSGDDERDSRLKIIPRIAEGSWLVKKGVGQTPAILGRKVKQVYYRDEVKNYIEIDCDVGSSVVAGKILSLVKSAATSLIIELTFLLQGETEEELPESLLTGLRICKPSLANTVGYQANHEATKKNMKFNL